MDVADGHVLVAVDRRVGHQSFHVGMKDAFGDQIVYLGSFAKDAAQTDVGAFEQGGGAGFLQVEQGAHLLVEVGVCKGVGGELIAQEVANHFFGVDDGVEHS